MAAHLAVAARRRLDACAPAVAGDLIAGEAQAQFDRFLIRRLSLLSARALYLGFTAQRTARLSPVARLLARSSDAPPRDLYAAFVRRMIDGDLVQLLGEHPALERLIARVSGNWVDATAEFAQRLAADHDDLQRVFHPRGDLGPVTAVQPGLSDPHRGGRTVTAVTFGSGTKIIYKPKDIGTEHAYNGLLTWLNNRDAPLDLRPIAVLARPGYGWVEFVEHEACADDRALQRYHQRAGMLLCLVYALAGTDCHRENLIAAGEHPVLVDTESLMHPRAVVAGGRPEARRVAVEELVSGVLGTGMLPNWQVDERADGRPAIDISALHTPAEEELVVHAPTWEAVNTDAMVLRAGVIALPPPASRPLLDGRAVSLADHAADVLEGFERFYRHLVDRRRELLAPDSPLRDLTRQRVRYVFRDTRVYGALHERLCEPEYLRDEALRAAELGRLGGARSGADPQLAVWWPLIDAEVDALQQADIPIFTARADGTTLTLPSGGELEGCLREPGARVAMRRLRAMGSDDMERQLGFVAGSLHANVARRRMPPTPPRPRRVGVRARPTDRVALERVALEIAAEMAERAIRTRDEATWIAPQYLPALERYQLQPIGYDLHGGACGVALFLAAVARVTGDGAYGRLALAALEPLRHALGDVPEAVAEDLRFGAAEGLGSIVYGLTRAGELLEEPGLLADAAAASALLTDERIDRAPADVFSGLAGEILGLLALHRAMPQAGALDTAQRCARRLLATRTAGARGGRAWVTVAGRLLTGFSHGAAGIAYALLRLAAVTDARDLRAAAAEAIAYEDGLFDPAADNWADLLAPEQPAFRASWCHGAPGIGLARLGGLGALDTPSIRRDIDAALRTTLRQGADGPDHLCCGALGRADLLLAAGERLDRPRLIAAARDRIADVVGRAQPDGFALNEFLPRHVYMPGFFEGMSGVGYEILRVADPQALPSVLLWE